MKKRSYIITAIVSYLVFLTATIPASMFSSLLEDNSPVKLQGISGTLWQGKASSISIDNTIRLQTTRWSFSPWKLFIGQIALDIETRYMDNDIRSEIGTSFLGRYFINDLSAKILAKDVAQLADIPLAQLSGLIALDIEHAQWKQGELPIATGIINWKDATVTVADTASLGNVSITLSESDQDLLNAEIKNQGGDIKISGTAELVPEADYAVDIKLTPTASANNNIKQSLGLFAQRQNNGDYILKKSGPLNQIM